LDNTVDEKSHTDIGMVVSIWLAGYTVTLADARTKLRDRLVFRSFEETA